MVDSYLKRPGTGHACVFSCQNRRTIHRNSVKVVYDNSSVLEVGPAKSIDINAKTIIPNITYIPID